MYDTDNPPFLMVTSHNARGLQTQVNERLAQGYELHGFPMLDARGGQNSSTWAQAMIKKTDRRQSARPS